MLSKERGRRGELKETGPGVITIPYKGGTNMQDQAETRVRNAAGIEAGIEAGERALLRYYESGSDCDFEEFAAWAEDWLVSQAEFQLRRWTCDRGALVADVVQLVLVRIARSRDRARWDTHRSSARTWMDRILRNVIFSHYRSRMARDARRQVKLTDELLWNAFAGACRGMDVVDGLVRDDECREAVGLMGQIPDHYRRAVELVVLDGCSHAEASRQLGVSAATVGRRVQKALRLLRSICEGRRCVQAWGQSAWLPLSA